MDLPKGARLKATLLALAAAGAILPAQATEQSDPKRITELTKLSDEYQQYRVNLKKQFMSLKTTEERQKFRLNPATENSFTERFFKIGKANPNDTVGEEALVWVVEQGSEDQRTEDALKLLSTDAHLKSQSLLPVIIYLSHVYSPTCAKFLQHIIDKSPDAPLRAAASYSLAKEYEETSADKAEVLLKSLVTHYKGVQVPGFRRPIDQIAETELFTVTHLGIGKPAPPLAGEDVSGKKLALSEFKGKIVLVDFFGDW